MTIETDTVFPNHPAICENCGNHLIMIQYIPEPHHNEIYYCEICLEFFKYSTPQ